MPPTEPEPAPSEPGAASPRTESFARRHLFQARTILVFGEVTPQLSENVVAQLLALTELGNDPVRLVINSPGGHVESADSIFDAIRFVSTPVLVLGTGWVASAGALIFAAAKKEHRFCLPNTRFLLHQPLGGVSGPASDVEIEARQVLEIRARLNRIFADATGQPLARIEKDTDRNHWLSAEQAREYGLVGRVIAERSAFKPS